MPDPGEETAELVISAAGRRLRGTLATPQAAKGVVLFAHGSGSGRQSPRNRLVARTLETAGFATLLIDLLEEPEAENRRNVFDIRLLAGRLAAAMEWLRQEERTSHLPLGLFGASTGAAAALVAAADRAEAVAAVVSRGGRPDLAMDDLPRVMAPTLLLVGSGDVDVLELNRAAMTRMTCETELVVIKGATHLFPEPGALEEVARLATEWFLRHLR